MGRSHCVPTPRGTTPPTRAGASGADVAKAPATRQRLHRKTPASGAALKRPSAAPAIAGAVKRPFAKRLCRKTPLAAQVKGRRQTLADACGGNPAAVRFAQDLRRLLPQMWHRFRRPQCPGSCKISFAELRAWLRASRKHGATNDAAASATEAALRDALQAVGCMPQYRQSLGFRFSESKDDESHWDVQNLKGFSSTPTLGISRKRCRSAEVSWLSYVARFRLVMPSRSSSTLCLERSMGTRRIVAEVEKRRRGDGPGLASQVGTITAYSRRLLKDDRRRNIKVQRRRYDLLPAVILRPVQPSRVPQYTLIYLHGLGSSAFDDYGSRPQYFLNGTIAVKVIIPTAPSRELTCFDGWWVKGSGGDRLNQFWSWYDYITNTDGKKEDAIDLSSLVTIQTALHELIRNEAQELGGRFDRVILGGKSQGCCTALDAALTFPERLAGFVGIVGHILGCTPVDQGGPQISTPFHFFHEPEDTTMRWDWVQPAQQRLRDAGYNVRTRHLRDPETKIRGPGSGHYVGGIEGRWIQQALASICGRSGVAGAGAGGGREA